MLPAIQSLWTGADFSNVEKLCALSFLDHEHECHLYTYGYIGGVPQGVTIKDTNEILPESEIFRNNRGSVAAFSDWFRYTMLNKRGNYWVDMDTIFLKPFSFDLDIVFGRGQVGTRFSTLAPGDVEDVATKKYIAREYFSVFLENDAVKHTGFGRWHVQSYETRWQKYRVRAGRMVMIIVMFALGWWIGESG